MPGLAQAILCKNSGPSAAVRNPDLQQITSRSLARIRSGVGCEFGGSIAWKIGQAREHRAEVVAER